MDKKNIEVIVVGTEMLGRSLAHKLAHELAACKINYVSVSDNTASSQITNNLRERAPFLITKTPTLSEPFIDKNELVNYKKHKQTCDKKRKARKKRKRK